MKPSRDEIKDVVIGIIKGMLHDWGIDNEPVSGATFLGSELGLSSIDAMQLLATLDLRLGTTLPFEKLVMSEGEYVRDLTVDQLADFAHQHFDERPAAPAAM